MARVDDLLRERLQSLGQKPQDTAKQSDKKRYSEQASRNIALALAEELRTRGLLEALPDSVGGAERRMSGGLGAKKVDVTWATEESGLLLGISIKTINFEDRKTKNYQKNLINRRSDMLMEAVTLHRRFPYAVLGGFFFLDKGAVEDDTEKRDSTFINAHTRLQLFTDRNDPSGREEQFEKMYIVLMSASPEYVDLSAYEVGYPDAKIEFETIVDNLLILVAKRAPDFYKFEDGRLSKV